MANMFSGNTTKTVPKTFDECIRIDAVSENLWTWTERLETWGKILFVLIIIIGIIATIATGVETSKYLEQVDRFELALEGITVPSVFEVVITSLFEWALYAFLEYLAYHILATLLGALASITQNTIITANIALFKAKDNTHPATTSNSVTTAKPTYTLGVRSTIEDDNWICGHCKTTNSMNYSQCKKCGQYRSL